MARAVPLLTWSGAAAGSSLTYASTAWLLSGLSASPFLNALLPALSSLPALVPLPMVRRGFLLKPAAAALLLLAAFRAGAGGPWTTLMVAPVLAFGERLSAVPLQRHLVGRTSVSQLQLRWAQDLGSWLGTVLTGVLFPFGRALTQAIVALVLMVPQLTGSLRHAPGGPAHRETHDHHPPLADPPRQQPGLHPAAAGQGMLFGGLFALLALWVRQLGEGNCFDFAMVLAAYLLGRLLRGTLPTMGGIWRYGLMAVLLLASQILPGWGAVLVFLPLGALAAASDQAIVEAIDAEAGALAWERLDRSGALGGVGGSLLMGGLAQVAGLPVALPVQVGGFTLAALLQWRGVR